MNRQGVQGQYYRNKPRNSDLKVANQAEIIETLVSGLTAQQIEQLLKLLLASSNSSTMSHSEENDDDLDYRFARIAVCFHAEQESLNWVIDIGSTDHITVAPNHLHNIVSNNAQFCIKLPNGTQVPINYTCGRCAAV